ncbi:MAG: cupin domain-containing protein [Pseudomonadota bacterium]
MAKNTKDMQFMAFPGLPTCTSGSVQNGDPSKEASIILVKAKSGCVIPWHWHTPSEHLMIVSGTARAEMKDGETVTLQSGGFTSMPAKHVHQFTCLKACTFYVASDGVFDLHYVDPAGQELAPADALKAVKETAASAPK